MAAKRTVLSAIALLVITVTIPHAIALDEELDCILEPNTEVELSAAVYGVLSEVLVKRNDKVEKGQVLASLMSGAEMAAVESAKARMEFNQRRAVRNEDLYKEELISIHEKDEMDTEVLVAKLELRQAEEQLALRKIISPINGLVIERSKDPGEYVEQEAFLTLVNLDPLHVEVVAPGEYIGRIKEGVSGIVQVMGPLGGFYPAKVSLVDQVIDAASGTIRIRLLLDNPDYKIPAGLKCLVSF